MLEDTQEIWREIKGYEGLYSVSNKGNVKNKKTNRLLGGGYNQYGYRFVKLKDKFHTVHRLVALAFIPNPQKLPQINHIDECKENNDVSNLEWCSNSYNANYSSHKHSCKIKQLDKNGNLVKAWESSMQINRETGYSQGNIISCCKGKRKQAYGFRWEYADTSQQHKFNHPVVVHKDGEYIGTFANAVKASEALGLKWISVYECLRGRIASTHGYTFSYK